MEYTKPEKAILRNVFVMPWLKIAKNSEELIKHSKEEMAHTFIRAAMEADKIEFDVEINNLSKSGLSSQLKGSVAILSPTELEDLYSYIEFLEMKSDTYDQVADTLGQMTDEMFNIGGNYRGDSND